MPVSERSRVLVVDDDAAMRAMLAEGLASETTSIETVAGAAAALERVASGEIDVVVTDLRMPGQSGLDLCTQVVQQTSALPVIVLTAFGDFETAVEAVRAGAYDFISKPVHLEVLRIAVDRALTHGQLRREVRRLRGSLEGKHFAGTLIGESRAMREVFDIIVRLADSGSSVLVTGESGTGKELVARALHDQSLSKGPFVAVNCAAIPEQLLESELFGHEKGAFTDAKTARAGLFMEANGGTLFLDEIGELPLGLQPKLLRALQERTIRPVGGRKDIPFDARLVAATNRDLSLAVEEGRFRQDLYFRVNVIELPIPPLRARGNDVLLLATHFLQGFNQRTKKGVVGLTPEVAAQFLQYNWPGNVRELSNIIERAVALTCHDHVTLADLPKHLVQNRRTEVVIGSDASELVSLEEMERRYVLHVLESVGGSRTAASKILGLDRTTLWRRLERYGVKAPDVKR
ncbi:MAG TPA: sigma-54 dependent transcriptional regulator [Polyangiaceae bacterium]|nr:sigma-54 dependent transcriptional regulator [Polyangiaceae bacterium]